MTVNQRLGIDIPSWSSVNGWLGCDIAGVWHWMLDGGNRTVCGFPWMPRSGFKLDDWYRMPYRIQRKKRCANCQSLVEERYGKRRKTDGSKR